jgi:hypothetical protein
MSKSLVERSSAEAMRPAEALRDLAALLGGVGR